jgi:hypothetical protein
VAGKVAFDQHPAGGEIAVMRRQGPETMQMVRKQPQGVDAEGVSVLHGPERLAEQRHSVRVAEKGAT